MKNRVLVLMSGGVDSSVTAYLLKNQGYDLVGLYILGWQGTEEFPCSWKEDYQDAQVVANQLGIRLELINLEQEYFQKVIQPFTDAYQQGLTPNPDVWCNQWIKFKAALEATRQFEYQFVATGHYVRVVKLAKDNLLYMGRDSQKDQSYFLWAIDREVLSRLILPLGEKTKGEVRKVALKANLKVKNKKDSQGVCFMGNLEVRQYLQQNLRLYPGKVLDKNGKLIARHSGVSLYTIGQRLGASSLKWQGAKQGDIPPLYIIAKDISNNRLIVGSDSDCFVKELISGPINWLIDPPKGNSFESWAKIRYRQKEVPCEAVRQNELWQVHFREKVRAPTQGQSIVFYDRKGLVLGGAIIQKVPFQEGLIKRV